MQEKMHDTNQTIDAYYAALKAGDRGEITALLSDDIQVDYYGPEGLFPWQGTWKGTAQFFAFLDSVAENLTIDAVTPMQRIIAEESAIIVLNGQWTIRKTGAKVTATVANIFTLKHGKIARYQVFTDTAAFGLGVENLTLRPHD